MIVPVAEAPVAGVRVLVRADLNAPLRDGAVADATRIERFAPTVRLLRRRGAALVVASHLGRPKGVRDSRCSLAPVAKALARAVDAPVEFAEDCVGPAARAATERLAPGAVVLLENLRFHGGEERNDAEFAQALSGHGALYVNDAFSCSHRAHASLAAIAGFLPAFGGPGLMAEIGALALALENPARPAVAMVGGAKVSDKIGVLESLVRRVDALVIGGAMANTFLAAQGHEVGRSLQELDRYGTARGILAAASAAGCEIVLPSDVVFAERLAADARPAVAARGAVPKNAMILDIGPATVAATLERIRGARTLLWSGPLGAFEAEPFAAGTVAAARAAAALTEAGGLTSVAGGGDTAAALNMAGVADRFTYVSTAGSAFLEYVEGRALPGIEALKRGAA